MPAAEARGSSCLQAAFIDRKRFGDRLLRRPRPVEDVALHHVAAKRLQDRDLPASFGAFRNGHHTERAPKPDDPLEEIEPFRVKIDPVNEASIDLEFEERQLRQISQRRVSGPEIIQRKLDAEAAHRLKARSTRPSASRTNMLSVTSRHNSSGGAPVSRTTF